VAIKNDFEDLADTLGDLGGLLIKRVVRAVQNMESSVSDGLPPEKATAHGNADDAAVSNDRRRNLQRQAMAVVGRSFVLPKFPGVTTPAVAFNVLRINAASRDAMGMVMSEDPTAIQMDVRMPDGEFAAMDLSLILVCKQVGDFS
jgi:hypothetical protein